MLLNRFAGGLDINSEKLNDLKNDLREIGSADMKFYRSTFSLNCHLSELGLNVSRQVNVYSLLSKTLRG